MKKILYILAISIFFIACSKDFLDREPLDRLSSEGVFNDEELVEAYLFQAYNYLPNGYGFLNYETPGVEYNGYTDQGAYIIDCLSDVLTNKSGWPTSNSTIIPGQIYADTDLPGLQIWERAYKVIRMTNSIMSNLKDSELSEDFKNGIKAEALFLRAFWYFELARRYGDVPIIKEIQSIEDIDALMVTRNPVSEVYAFIDEDLTASAEFLKAADEQASEDYGRATKDAAWALNGRAQLYAKNYTRSAELSKMVIDSAHFELSADYNSLFQSHGGDAEVIFEIMFDGANKGHSLDALAFPFSYRTDWGSQFLPTNEMVESYEMTNGLAISDPGSGYDPENPFINRDSRLTASVLYEGNFFKGEAMEITLSTDISVLPHGEDAPGLSGNHTTTGFYLKKFLDETMDDSPPFGASAVSWKEIRLAEVLLNYAEAQNEAVGPDETVYAAINQVRTRAGQPNLATGLSQSEMFDKIVQERKVELFAEGFRYWDLKRWRMAEEVLNGNKVHGLFITRDANNPEILTYEVVEANNRPTYVFLEQHYLLPIPQDEIDKNPNLVQNPGY